MVSYEQIILLKDYSGSFVDDKWERTVTGGRKTKYKSTILNKQKLLGPESRQSQWKR